MTAAEHLAQAEDNLMYATERGADGYTNDEANLLLRALVHAVAAVAIELGVPPVSPDRSGVPGG